MSFKTACCFVGYIVHARLITCEIDVYLVCSSQTAFSPTSRVYTVR